MIDTVVPDYFTRKKGGEIINNPVTFTRTRVDAVGGWNYYRKQNNDVYTVVGNGSLSMWATAKHWPSSAFPSNPSVDIPSLQAQAKLSSFSNVDSTPYGFAEDVGEIGETLRFIRNPLSSLVTLGTAFRKKWLKRARQIERSKTQRVKTLKKLKRSIKDTTTDPVDLAIDEVWLSYRFAFSPLLRSAMSLIEAYKAPIHRPPRRASRSFKKGSASKVTTQDLGTYNKRDVTQKVEVEVAAGILYEVKNPVEDFQFKYGLRLKDVPVTLWNLLPLSFMVDRVVNISDSISGLTNILDPKVKILTGWVVTKTSVYRSYTYRYLASQPGWTNNCTFDSVVDETFSYSREVWQPTIQDLLPPVTLGNLVSDINSTLDLLTIVHSCISKKARKWKV
jgi:hypothetical protein